jgi:hypothetical protein
MQPEALRALPLPGLLALIALGIVQLTLQVIAVMDLSRRTVVTGGRKWVWIVAVVLGGIVGAAVYLAIGRKPSQVAEGNEPQAANDAARRRALDALYGPGERDERG